MADQPKHLDIDSVEGFALYCADAFPKWENELDAKALTVLAEFMEDRTLSGALALVGLLAVNVINNSADNEDMACRISRALGAYIHTRCHESFTEIQQAKAMAEKAASKTKEQ